jgi:O-antigen ligase
MGTAPRRAAWRGALQRSSHRNNYRAYLYVTIDGEDSRSLPEDERGTYAVLTSPDYAPRVEPILIAEGLEPLQRHTAHIEAERGWDQWAIRGFAVGSDVDTRGHDAGIATLLVGAAALLVIAYWLGRPKLSLERFQQMGKAIGERLGATLHLLLALAATLAFWTGAALTWGGAIPNVLRRIGEGPSLLITVLTAGIFYYSHWLVLTLIALSLLFLLIYARPGIGLALMMFFAAYYLLPRELFDRMFSVVEVVSLLTLLAWGLHIVAERREKGWPSLSNLWQQMTALDKAGTAGGIAVLSLTWAEIKGVAITELRQMVIEPMVMYLVLRTMPLDRAERWRIVDVLIVTGVIVAAIGFYQVATGYGAVTAEAGTVRLRSVFFAPNNAALFLGRLIPITAAVVLIGGTRTRQWLYGVAGFVMLAAAILTLSKGGLLLGIPAGLGLVVVLWGGRRALIAVAAGAVLELLALIPLSQHPRFRSLLDFSSGESSSFFRIQLLQSTLRMIADHPITGVGLDQFLYHYRGKYILPSAWQQPDLNQPHNVWLNYWVRLGIVGLIAGVWLQIAFWRMAWRVQSAARGKDKEIRALAVGLMGSMAAFLAHGLVDEVHFVIELAFVFFMTLGLMHTLAQDIAPAEGGAGNGDPHQRPDTAAGGG